MLGALEAAAGARGRVSAPVYVFFWGNNERRRELKGRLCVVEIRGRMSTVLVRFLDTGERVTTSFRALRFERSGELDVEDGVVPVDVDGVDDRANVAVESDLVADGGVDEEVDGAGVLSVDL